MSAPMVEKYGQREVIFITYFSTMGADILDGTIESCNFFFSPGKARGESS